MNYLRISLILLASIGLIACGGGPQESTTAEEETPKADYPAARSVKLAEIGLASPESIIGDGEFYYVSNVGKELKPSEKDGDGFIMKLDVEGNVVTEKLVEGLDAPKGSAIVNGVIYVADIDKVKGFNLSDGSPAGELDMSETGTVFLNDIVKKDDQSLYVSATDISAIYIVSLGAEMSYEKLEYSPNVNGPNGLYLKGNKLYVTGYNGANTGKLGEITLTSAGNTYKDVNNFQGALDGLQEVGGSFFYSDWSRGVIAMQAPGAASVGAFPISDVQIQGPADFFYDAARNEFWVPAMQENVIYIKSLHQ
ncbi:MAG: hypothetical protein AAF206_05865 [Bacteroidota bacterium]